MARDKRQFASRAPEGKDFPADASGAGFQFDGGGLFAPGTIKRQGFLGQVFENAALLHLQPGVLGPGHPMAVGLVELGRRWRG